MAFSVQSRQKEATRVKSKAKSMLIILFGIKGSVHKEFVLVGQTDNSAYCCDVLWRLRENVLSLTAKELAVASRQRAVSHFLFFTREFKKKYNCRPPITLLFCVSSIEDKTERPLF
jgi:hypothetical protein